ncbi:MAG TPA: hypothetical protein VMA13_02210 [Candidatus Saccharimonadales bacterium]|nr:hypothetical protein [Candidatus Saccharimonadales bacterium]
MKTQWFKRLGWFYIPVSLPGAIITLAVLAFCAQVFLAIDHNSHSASDTLYGVFPFFASAFLLFDWIAGRTAANLKTRAGTLQGQNDSRE